MKRHSQSTRANGPNNKIQSTAETTHDDTRSISNSTVSCNPSSLYHQSYT
uniref:Uncharacterized protein n=1 Tax=Arundo donax TaxID=35708 RepID=A0A0A9G2Y2_ARUDO